MSVQMSKTIHLCSSDFGEESSSLVLLSFLLFHVYAILFANICFLDVLHFKISRFDHVSQLKKT